MANTHEIDTQSEQAQVVAGLEALAEKFDRPVQVFLWDRNQDRVKLVRTALRLLSPETDRDG